MELHLAVRAFELLLGWSLLLQTIEYLRLGALDRVSHWPVQRTELPCARPGSSLRWTHSCSLAPTAPC